MYEARAEKVTLRTYGNNDEGYNQIFTVLCSFVSMFFHQQNPLLQVWTEDISSCSHLSESSLEILLQFFNRI